jgi:hypothetical protein
MVFLTITYLLNDRRIRIRSSWSGFGSATLLTKADCLIRFHRNSDPDPYLWLMAPDPGGPITYGSGGSGFGSATLLTKADCLIRFNRNSDPDPEQDPDPYLWLRIQEAQKHVDPWIRIRIRNTADKSRLSDQIWQKFGSGSIPLSYGSGSRRPKNKWIR